jgi:hypothetical protein
VELFEKENELHLHVWPQWAIVKFVNALLGGAKPEIDLDDPETWKGLCEEAVAMDRSGETVKTEVAASPSVQLPQPAPVRKPNPDCPLCQGLGSWVEGEPCGCTQPAPPSLSAEQVRKACYVATGLSPEWMQYCGRWQKVADRLNALLGAEKPADPEEWAKEAAKRIVRQITDDLYFTIDRTSDIYRDNFARHIMDCFGQRQPLPKGDGG